MYQTKKLAALCRVTDAALKARQARVAMINHRKEHLRSQLTNLDTAVAERAQTMGTTEDDTALDTGADMLWLRWIESRKIAINMELARLEVFLLEERDFMAKEFGRDQVAQKLHKRAQAAARRPRTEW